MNDLDYLKKYQFLLSAKINLPCKISPSTQPTWIISKEWLNKMNALLSEVNCVYSINENFNTSAVLLKKYSTLLTSLDIDLSKTKISKDSFLTNFVNSTNQITDLVVNDASSHNFSLKSSSFSESIKRTWIQFLRLICCLKNIDTGVLDNVDLPSGIKYTTIICFFFISASFLIVPLLPESSPSEPVSQDINIFIENNFQLNTNNPDNTSIEPSDIPDFKDDFTDEFSKIIDYLENQISGFLEHNGK